MDGKVYASMLFYAHPDRSTYAKFERALLMSVEEGTISEVLAMVILDKALEYLLEHEDEQM